MGAALERTVDLLVSVRRHKLIRYPVRRCFLWARNPSEPGVSSIAPCDRRAFGEAARRSRGRWQGLCRPDSLSRPTHRSKLRRCLAGLWPDALCGTHRMRRERTERFVKRRYAIIVLRIFRVRLFGLKPRSESCAKTRFLFSGALARLFAPFRCYSSRVSISEFSLSGLFRLPCSLCIRFCAFCFRRCSCRFVLYLL